MPLIRVVEGRQVLRRIKRDLAHVDARVVAASDTGGEVSIRAPKRAVATTNEAAIRQNLRVMVPSW